MGYRGQPSRGCHACRIRKTRCDQLRPSCTQCKRTKRECPGYRVDGDLIFRNETAKVEQKFKAKKKKVSICLESTVDSSSNEGACLIRIRNQNATLPSFLPLNLDDRAVSLFISNFVNGKNGPSRGHMEYFEDLARTEAFSESLLAGMKAVGFAVCAHRDNEPRMIQRARYEYVKALQLTNTALQDPLDVKSDSTLVGIIVLGIYETLVGRKPDSHNDWMYHFNGAAAIIKLRGPEQLSTTIGMGIFVTVCRNLLIASIQHAISLPRHLRNYMNKALSTLRKENANPSFRIIHCMMQFGDLRVDFVNKTVSEKDILKRATELDQILVDITRNHPPAWSYAKFDTDVHSPFIYKGHYHIYSDLRITQVWNMLRTLRIMINQMVYDILNSLISEHDCPVYTTQLIKVSKNLYEVQHDILCSVPQIIGVFHSKNVQDIPHNERGLRVPMSGTWYLCRPLWLAALLRDTPKDIKDFVVYNLRNISTIGGIKEGDSLADSIESKKVCHEPDFHDRIYTIAKMDASSKKAFMLPDNIDLYLVDQVNQIVGE